MEPIMNAILPHIHPQLYTVISYDTNGNIIYTYIHNNANNITDKIVSEYRYLYGSIPPENSITIKFAIKRDIDEDNHIYTYQMQNESHESWSMLEKIVKNIFLSNSKYKISLSVDNSHVISVKPYHLSPPPKKSIQSV